MPPRIDEPSQSVAGAANAPTNYAKYIIQNFEDIKQELGTDRPLSNKNIQDRVDILSAALSYAQKTNAETQLRTQLQEKLAAAQEKLVATQRTSAQPNTLGDKGVNTVQGLNNAKLIYESISEKTKLINDFSGPRTAKNFETNALKTAIEIAQVNGVKDGKGNKSSEIADLLREVSNPTAGKEPALLAHIRQSGEPSHDVFKGSSAKSPLDKQDRVAAAILDKIDEVYSGTHVIAAVSPVFDAARNEGDAALNARIAELASTPSKNVGKVDDDKTVIASNVSPSKSFTDRISDAFRNTVVAIKQWLDRLQQREISNETSGPAKGNPNLARPDDARSTASDVTYNAKGVENSGRDIPPIPAEITIGRSNPPIPAEITLTNNNTALFKNDDEVDFDKAFIGTPPALSDEPASPQITPANQRSLDSLSEPDEGHVVRDESIDPSKAVDAEVSNQLDDLIKKFQETRAAYDDKLLDSREVPIISYGDDASAIAAPTPIQNKVLRDNLNGPANERVSQLNQIPGAQLPDHDNQANDRALQPGSLNIADAPAYLPQALPERSRDNQRISI